MAALVRADERLKKEFALIALPVLILHGTVDKNTKPGGSQHFYDKVGSVDKTLSFTKEGFTIFSTTSTSAWSCRTSNTGSVLGFLADVARIVGRPVASARRSRAAA
jgi:hypothetical protein